MTGMGLAASALAAAVLAAGSAQAATENFNLIGHAADLAVEYEFEPGPIALGIVPLLDPSTGQNLTPAFELSVGDVVQGAVTLDHPITIPASGLDSEIQLNIASTQGTDVYEIGYTPTVSLYDHGAPVALPPGYLIGTGSVGALSFGGFVTGSAIPSITFDQIDFSASITHINNLDDQPISSAEIPASAPNLEYIVFSPIASPAPEPAAWAFMILGFGALGLRLRRRAALGAWGGHGDGEGPALR